MARAMGIELTSDTWDGIEHHGFPSLYVGQELTPGGSAMMQTTGGLQWKAMRFGTEANAAVAA
jgi:hypothetical protein